MSKNKDIDIFFEEFYSSQMFHCFFNFKRKMQYYLRKKTWRKFTLPFIKKKEKLNFIFTVIRKRVKILTIKKKYICIYFY